jgi:glucose-6-phosphate dehydrogenase assembly protein OpcA
MAEQINLEQIAAWHEDHTNLRALTQALTCVWQDANRNRNDDARRPQTSLVRSRVANLVVFAAERGIAERAASAIAHISGTYPSRSILIVPDPNAASGSLSASLSVYGTTDGEMHRFSFERIELTVRGTAIQYIPGIVTQLAVHDLPTLLWWPGDPPFNQPLFTSLVATADHVLVDSSDFINPQAGLRHLALLAHARPGHARLSDLNWHRLTHWREMVAQFFDSTAALPYLDRIAEGQIEHAFDPVGQQSSAQAVLLAGWLASRLGWQIEDSQRHSDDGYTWRWRRTTGDRVVLLSRSVTGRHLRAGVVCRLTLSAAQAGQPASFAVAVEGDGEHATTSVQIGAAAAVHRTVRLDQGSESSLLAAEIETLGGERAFDDALPVAARIAEQVLALD